MVQAGTARGPTKRDAGSGARRRFKIALNTLKVKLIRGMLSYVNVFSDILSQPSLSKPSKFLIWKLPVGRRGEVPNQMRRWDSIGAAIKVG